MRTYICPKNTLTNPHVIRMRSTLPRPRMPRQREMASTIELSRLNITPLVTLSDALLLYWRTLSFFLFQHLDNAVLWKHKWLVHGSVVRFFTLSLCLWGPLLEAPRAPLSLILSTKEGYWGWSKIQDVTHKMWRNTGGKDKCLDYTPSSPSSRHEALISALDWVSSKLPVWAGEGCLGFLGFVSFDRWISHRPKISPNGPNVSMSGQHSSPNLGER